jgi:hypothetical protein
MTLMDLFLTPSEKYPTILMKKLSELLYTASYDVESRNRYKHRKG